jgi:quercetin dioxygenase-like cupin family protein
MAGEVGVDPREMPWQPDQRRLGIARKLLRGSRDAEYTTLLRLDAGVRFPSHSHPAGEELFVVDGRIRIEGTWYEAGCYIYSPPGAVHDVFSDTGATMLIRMPGPGEILED